MKQLATLVVLAIGCTLVRASDRPQPPQQSRMAVCQKEATASGKKGAERKAVLRACLVNGKAGGKAGGRGAKAG